MSTSRFIRWRSSNPESYARALERRKKRYADDAGFRERRQEMTRQSVLKKKKRGPKKQVTETPELELGDVND